MFFINALTHFGILFDSPLQEECLLSDPQGESDADADIEDTDGRYDVDINTILTC